MKLRESDGLSRITLACCRWGFVVDTETQPLNTGASLNEVSSYLASYNLLAVPVVDPNERLLGAVTVDDVLDHLLPENWRHSQRAENSRKEGQV